jgi:hypothetical protein
MSARIDPLARDRHVPTPVGLTLLDLVQTVSRFARSEDETVAVVYHMLETGRVRLTGSFRNHIGPRAN